MKRPFKIILSVVGAIIVISVLLMNVLSPRVGNTFNTISSELPGYGGGAPVSEVYLMEPAMGAPAPMEYDVARQVMPEVNLNAIQQQVERKVIKNADLSVVVKDPLKSMEDITALAEEMGGYVVSSNVYQTTYGPNDLTVPAGNIVIRIPAEKLEETLAKVKADVVEVTSENVSGQDVTDQYVDLTSRLSAKQAAEKKLLEIMDQATATEDVLAVYQQLQMIQSEIEVLKGQIKYIDQSVAMSSLSVSLTAEESAQPIEIGGWKIQGTAKESIEGLVGFLQGFVRFLIRFFLNYLWQILLIVLPLYGVYVGGRVVYRRFFRSKAIVEVKEEERK